jgi:predicted transposase YdaD
MDMEHNRIASYEKGEATGLAKGIREVKREGKREGIREGKREGIIEGKISVARSMLADKQPFELIAIYSGLSVEEIASLR